MAPTIKTWFKSLIVIIYQRDH